MDIPIPHRGHGDDIKIKGIGEAKGLKVHESKGSQHGDANENKKKYLQSSFDFDHGTSGETFSGIGG